MKEEQAREAAWKASTSEHAFDFCEGFDAGYEAGKQELTAELKELREFVGAINSFGSEQGYGFYHVVGAGRIFTIYAGDDNELVATGTDPFDAWRKMNAGEG